MITITNKNNILNISRAILRASSLTDYIQGGFTSHQDRPLTLWEQGVVGSNPATPTKIEKSLANRLRIFFTDTRKAAINCKTG